jgi:hypothetical protein
MPAGLLAPGQVADRHVQLLRLEQELLRPRRHVQPAVAVDDGVAVRAQGVPQRRRRVEGRPPLLEQHCL